MEFWDMQCGVCVYGDIVLFCYCQQNCLRMRIGNALVGIGGDVFSVIESRSRQFFFVHPKFI